MRAFVHSRAQTQPELAHTNPTSYEKRSVGRPQAGWGVLELQASCASSTQPTSLQSFKTRRPIARRNTIVYIAASRSRVDVDVVAYPEVVHSAREATRCIMKERGRGLVRVREARR